MKHTLYLLMFGLAVGACSRPGIDAPDLGNPMDDLGAAEDAATGGPALNLVAGGVGGIGNADDTGSVARFNGSRSVIADGAGNLYLADTTNNTIRKVVLQSGMVTTLAGQAGASGSTDGTGSAARFNRPIGLAMDGASNLYVADTGNNTIRKVVLQSGAVTTLAGAAGMLGSADGTGSAARFNSPFGIAADGAGNVYVADSSNNTIRQVALSTGMVTTLAGAAGMAGTMDGIGNGARFNRPSGVAADGAGNLYVADTGNSMIRRVVIMGGVVTSLAGAAGGIGGADGTGSAARFQQPIGVAVDGTGNVYVADTNNYTIRRVVIMGGVVTTVAGTTGMVGSADGTGSAARFDGLSGLTLDGAGNVYIADTNNGTIRKLVLMGAAVTTPVGTASQPGSADGTGSAARLNGASGMAADGAGNVYFADTANHLIRKIVLSSGVVTTLAGGVGLSGSTDSTGTAARFNRPLSLALDGAGNLYVADTSNHTIRKIVVDTGVVTTLAGAVFMQASVDGIGTAARFNGPMGMTIDGAGNLYLVDNIGSMVRKVVLTSGAVSTLAGTVGMAGNNDGIGTAARFRRPFATALDGAGNLYIADTNNHTIRKLVLQSGAVTTLAGTAGIFGSVDGIGSAARFNLPAGLVVDAAGKLQVADSGNSTIRQINLASAEVTTVVGVAGRRGLKPGPLPARLNTPSGLATSPAASLLIADEGENAILSVR